MDRAKGFCDRVEQFRAELCARCDGQFWIIGEIRNAVEIADL